MKKNISNLSPADNEGTENISVDERRDFLKMGLAITGVFCGGTIISATSAVSRVFASAGAYAEKYPYKPHYSMVLQVDFCIDCELCMEACVETNSVPDYGWRTKILEYEMPRALGVKREFIPILCNQCNLPQCARVCPTRATYKDRTHGIVMMDRKKCIGCMTCQLGCPYNARYFNEVFHAVDKCDFCHKERLSAGDDNTSCSEACPADVRIFGDLADPRSRVYRMVHQLEKAVWVMRPKSGTKPNIFYTKGWPLS